MATNASKAGAKRKRDDTVQENPRKARKTSIENDDDASAVESDGGVPVKTSSKHTKKERKNNPSSRIHSLKKLLARDTLPSNIRQEKERELAALEYDQNKHKSQKQDKKVLEKYHYVRFVERQKAEKRLKQLRKLLKIDDEAKRQIIEKDIDDMEVNRNYAIYAPLHEKYASIFVKTKGKKDGVDESERLTEKPEIWYEVQAAMKEGQSALEALRDGKRRLKPKDEEEEQPTRSKSLVKSNKITKTSTNLPENRRARREAERTTVQSDDEDMSDGGFFER